MTDTETAQPWRLWRHNEPEPGSAPAFGDLDAAQQKLWFGDFAADEAACCAAWHRLRVWIATVYPGCHLLQTPGATGLSLIQHTLPWGGGLRPYRYLSLPENLSRLLAATAPQHRFERLWMFPGYPEATPIYDARVAHLAYLSRLPVTLEEGDPLLHDAGPYVPYHAGKYRAAVRVPQGWHHIGLVPRRRADGISWEWPNTPGEQWDAWLDECEVRLLWQQGWSFLVVERILFGAGPKTPGNDPLREHVARLSAEIERIERVTRTPTIRAYRAALRAIATHPIGLWHKQDNKRSRHIASDDELTADDAGATIVPDVDGGYTVINSAALSAWQAHWRRTEWSTTVYARERVRVTQLALSLPRSLVVAIRGDALHLSDDPHWQDTGKVGSYRLKIG